MNTCFLTEFNSCSTRPDWTKKGSPDLAEAVPTFAGQLLHCCQNNEDTPDASPEAEVKNEVEPDEEQQAGDLESKKSGIKNAMYNLMTSRHAALSNSSAILTPGSRNDSTLIGSAKNAGEKGDGGGDGKQPAVGISLLNRVPAEKIAPTKEAPAANAKEAPRVSGTTVGDKAMPPSAQEKLPRTHSSPSSSGRSRFAASVAAERILTAPPSPTLPPHSLPLNLAVLNWATAETDNPRPYSQPMATGFSGFGQSPVEGERHRGDANQSSLLGNPSGRVDSASTQKAETLRIFVGQLDSALQTMRQEKSSNIRLQVSLERGEIIKIHLSLRGSKLKTTIQTENEQIRQLLRSSWSEVSRSLATKGVDAETMEFENESNSSSTKEDRDFQEHTEAKSPRSHVNSKEPMASPGSPDDIVELRNYPFFSRIA